MVSDDTEHRCQASCLFAFAVDFHLLEVLACEGRTKETKLESNSWGQMNENAQQLIQQFMTSIKTITETR